MQMLSDRSLAALEPELVVQRVELGLTHPLAAAVDAADVERPVAQVIARAALDWIQVAASSAMYLASTVGTDEGNDSSGGHGQTAVSERPRPSVAGPAAGQ